MKNCPLVIPSQVLVEDVTLTRSYITVLMKLFSLRQIKQSWVSGSDWLLQSVLRICNSQCCGSVSVKIRIRSVPDIFAGSESGVCTTSCGSNPDKMYLIIKENLFQIFSVKTPSSEKILRCLHQFCSTVPFDTVAIPFQIQTSYFLRTVPVKKFRIFTIVKLKFLSRRFLLKLDGNRFISTWNSLICSPTLMAFKTNASNPYWETFLYPELRTGAGTGI